MLAEAERAELNDTHVFDRKKALCCLDTDPFGWERREKSQLVLVVVWRCDQKVYGRLARINDLIAQLTQ